jgi:hypothetical protein
MKRLNLRSETRIHCRFLTVTVDAMGGGSPEFASNFWIDPLPLHFFGRGVPINFGAITRVEFFVAEIFPGKGVPVPTAGATASMSDAHLAFVIANEIQSQLGPTWAVKVTHINRNPASRPEFEEYSRWLANLP